MFFFFLFFFHWSTPEILRYISWIFSSYSMRIKRRRKKMWRKHFFVIIFSFYKYISLCGPLNWIFLRLLSFFSVKKKMFRLIHHYFVGQSFQHWHAERFAFHFDVNNINGSSRWSQMLFITWRSHSHYLTFVFDSQNGKNYSLEIKWLI